MQEEYLDAFLAESMEHVEQLEACCLALERDGFETRLLDEMFRSAHTLKGMSATMGFSQLAGLTHKMEDLLGALRDGRVRFESAHIDVLLQAVDRMRARLEAIASSGAEPAEPDHHLLQALAGVRDQAPGAMGDEASSSALVVPWGDLAKQVEAKGQALYAVRIQLAPDCVMPGVRLAMAYQALQSTGELLAADPPEDEVMAGKIESTEALVAVAVRPGEIDRVRQRVLDLTDIARCDVDLVDPEPRADQASQRAQTAEPEPMTPETTGAPSTRETPNRSSSHSREAQLRVPVRKVDALINALSDLVITKTRLTALAASVGDAELRDAVERLDRLTADMQDGLMRLRMVPVESIFQRYPRMMRDLERRLGREFDFVMTGLDTEMDRVVLEEMGEVIVHLLRNAADHGLEPPDVREANGKPRRGTIRLAAYTAGGHVYLEVSDDGQGIDRERVLESAVAKGLVAPEEGAAMPDESVYALLFRPGFSTAKRVSDISGRGVGLDAVREKVEALGGTIRLDSVPGQGTTFTIELPLTLAILSALLVSVRGQVFVIPAANVVDVRRISRDEVRHVHERPVLRDDQGMIPVIDVAERLGLGPRNEAYPQTAVVCWDGRRRLALVVDAVLDELEIVNKPLGKYLQAVREFAGATILGDGRVSLILDVRAIATIA
ncbi:chemotaxis protein CheA [Alicyclobacillus vulcanalis]|uniref:Chemotaxis protein CheA n=1 Tax=Alicyclobacillus vulcanalis TaxID=252246 RepID=A0A1N7MW36_9BACL|nr:chemotaxis protein CheA [Alicyclobacillus vulcanalis]SIS90306.1 two-component system, chemotaxis family, sensor kinase CheA [Alicyclobacillus vulcanalis]